ncbi:MAG: ZIP family metal transporter [Coxiella endosymbiont of Dermacentor nuttalli]
MVKCSGANLFLLGINISLFDYKCLIACIIAIVSLTVGFMSLHFVRRYQHLLLMSDAFADGIFLGTAVFHLFPDAIQGLLNKVGTLSSYILVIVFMGFGFLLLFSLERSIIRREKQYKITSTNQMCMLSTWMLTGILSIHALIVGAVFGISDTINDISLLSIAILIHKGFESFALMMGLHFSIKSESKIKGTLWAFSFVTPFGIIMAAFIEFFLQTRLAVVITSLFSAFAAGSFFYIGTCHGVVNKHFHSLHDPLKCYQKVLSISFGIIAMAIVRSLFGP